MIPEIKAITDAVRSLALKINGGEITRENVADVAMALVKQACILNNAIIDALPPEYVECGTMAFADMLAELTDDIRDNGGKVRTDG